MKVLLPFTPRHQRRTVDAGALQSPSIKHEKVMKEQQKERRSACRELWDESGQASRMQENDDFSGCLSYSSDTAGGG